MTILGTHTGLQVGGDGATHAAVEDIGITRTFPNLTIIQPSDGVSAKALAHAAVDFRGPLYVRLHRNAVPDFYDPETFKFEFGKAITVKEYGTDLTIISSGIMLQKCADAAEQLKDKGINVRLLDMMTLKPLDEEAVIKAAKETGAILTVEDHSVINGLGAAVASVAGAGEDHRYPGPLRRVRRSGASLQRLPYGYGFHRRRGGEAGGEEESLTISCR